MRERLRKRKREEETGEKRGFSWLLTLLNCHDSSHLEWVCVHVYVWPYLHDLGDSWCIADLSIYTICRSLWIKTSATWIQFYKCLRWSHNCCLQLQPWSCKHKQCAPFVCMSVCLCLYVDNPVFLQWKHVLFTNSIHSSAVTWVITQKHILCKLHCIFQMWWCMKG